MYVAYYFVEFGLPWTDYIDLKMEEDIKLNLYDLKEFKKIRILHEATFSKELERTFSPFKEIFIYSHQII